MKNLQFVEKMRKKFEKTLAFYLSIVYNNDSKVVKSGAKTEKSGVKGGKPNALRQI